MEPRPRGLLWEVEDHMAGGGGRGWDQVGTLFRLLLLSFYNTHLSVSCLAGIDLLVDDLRIDAIFR